MRGYDVVMALCRDDLTPEQLARQEAYDRSWASLQEARANPEMVAWLREQIRRLDERPPAPKKTKEEFLAESGLTGLTK